MRTFAQSPKVQLSASAKVTGPVSAHSKHAPDFNAIPSPVASVHAPDLTGIPPTVRARMERSLRTDFSDVRVETDSAHAVKIRAEAFTQGSYIHVAPGYWAPETPKGLRLLGHELGHVLQQRSGRVPTTGYLAGTALNDDPALEREADEFGRQAEYSAREALPPCASPGRGGQKSSQGVAQRSPIDKGDPIHGPMLDEFSKETGTPRDTASQHDPAFQAWLTVRNLDRQSMGEILASLDDTESRGELNSLIADASVVPPPRYKRVTTAMKVVRQSRGAGANSQTALATIASAGLPAADQLAMRHFVNVPATHGADQRAAIAPGGAAALPNAGLTRDIGFEIDPGSRPAPVAPPVNQPPGVPPPPPPPRVPWDGRTGAAGAAAARTAMQNELFDAFDAYLKNKRAETLAKLARPRVSFTTPAAGAAGAAPAPTGVVDIANQARAVLEVRYSTSMDAATSSPGQVSSRAVRQASGPGQNLFDASSEADRSTLVGDPNLAHGVAWWLFENDVPGAAGAAGSRRFSTEILAAHHYSAGDDPNGQFRWSVADAYAAAHTLNPDNKRQLIDYRMTAWSEADPSASGRGFTVQSSFDPGANQNRSELSQRWQIFKSSTHESLHLRTHPRFTEAAQGRGSLKEGFTEMFAIATLNTDVLPRARDGNAEPIRRTVEGALSTPKPDATIITDAVTPTQYVEHRAAAERIRDGGTPTGGTPHAGVGEAAVRAAYFQGHVEYLGLSPGGAQLPAQPAAGVPLSVRVPAGIAGLDDLARRSGVPRATIVRDNPGITDALPPTALLAGCREHWAVAGETRSMVAKQNGVSEAALVRANPDIPLNPATSAWPDLVAGKKLLIPVH